MKHLRLEELVQFALGKNCDTLKKVREMRFILRKILEKDLHSINSEQRSFGVHYKHD